MMRDVIQYPAVFVQQTHVLCVTSVQILFCAKQTHRRTWSASYKNVTNMQKRINNNH